MQNWIAILGVIVNLCAIAIAYFAFNQSVTATKASLDLTRKSIEQNNLATIYSLSQATHSFLIEDPTIAIHFDKVYRENLTDKELLDDFHSSNLQRRVTIWHGCESIADFMQLSFAQKDLLPKEDWESWLNYFSDLQQESPVFRKFLETRENWYNFQKKLEVARKKPKENPWDIVSRQAFIYEW